MKYHQGRLIDHIGVRVSDLERSKRFYVAVLEALGKGGFGADDASFYFDEFYVAEGAPPVTGLHLAFQAGTIDQVHAFYKAGLTATVGTMGRRGIASIMRLTMQPFSSTLTVITSKPTATLAQSDRAHR